MPQPERVEMGEMMTVLGSRIAEKDIEIHVLKKNLIKMKGELGVARALLAAEKEKKKK